MKNIPVHRTRIETCLAGGTPDQTPVALWRHFPVDDQTPQGLAAATAAFQRQYEFDLVKVTPASSFCLKDWGIRDRWAGNPEGTRDHLNTVIQSPEDWRKLFPLDPKKGSLGDQLQCLDLLVHDLDGQVPIIQTIFSPMAQAKNLVGKENLLVHLRRYPQALKEGLERITETTLRFIEAASKTGVDGVFYAVQHAQYGLLSKEEFKTFGREYDLRILNACQHLWLNMAHLHGDEVMFDLVKDYPVSIINWHDRQSRPDLAEAQTQFKGVVCGGLRQWESMVLGTPDEVRAEATQAIQATGGTRFILGTGCVLPITAPYGNILAAVKTARSAWK
jgi:uroporphyrinogen decarboxylase